MNTRQQEIVRIASMVDVLTYTSVSTSVHSTDGTPEHCQSAINGRKRRSNMENFKVGDTVQWASSANGYWKEKKGIVESVIPAGGNPQI